MKMKIDQCYEGILAKLTSQGKIKKVTNDLQSKTKNYERVLLTYDILTDLNTFPKLEIVSKSENLSTHYRNQGNLCYHNTDYLKALQNYNISLLYAPLNTQNYYLGVSNRSAVLIELKEFKECLKDIELVLTFNVSDKLKEKLIKRKEICEVSLQKEDKSQTFTNNEIQDILKFKNDCHGIYTSASSKLEVKYDKVMGRHVVSKENIKVGEVISEEAPYTCLLLKSQFIFSCSYCLSRDLNILPCETCCFAMYCSDECKMKAFQEYHEIECPLMATLIAMEFTKLELMALRTAIKARSDHKSWNSLFKTIEEAESKIGTEFHGQVQIDGKWVYNSKYYSSIHTLETNIDKRSISDIFQKSVTAAVFLKLLTNTKFLMSTNSEDEEKIRECIAGNLLLHLMTVPTNMHGLSTNMQNKEGKCIDEVSLASGAYAFASLINHSCAPNVVRYNTLGTSRMRIMAIRPIKKGEQIFDNYGAHHAIEDKASRMGSLKFQYKFVCQCEACANNWPTYRDLQLHRKKLPQKIQKFKEKILSVNAIGDLERGNVKTALKIFDPLCRLCDELEPFRPCMDLCDCQEALKQCLTILEGLIPFGHCLTVSWKPILV